MDSDLEPSRVSKLSAFWLHDEWSNQKSDVDTCCLPSTILYLSTSSRIFNLYTS